MGAHSGGLYHILKEGSCRPSTALPPPRQTFIHGRPRPLPLSARPPNAPTVPGAHRSPYPPPQIAALVHSGNGGGVLRQGTEDERTRSERGRPRWLTLVTRSAMASSSPGSCSVGRSRAREPPTSRGPEATADQQPFLRSTPGGAGPGLGFKPRTAPSLLVSSWHSLPSHWRLPVPPRMRFLGDPAETFGGGRGQAFAPRAAVRPAGEASRRCATHLRGAGCAGAPREPAGGTAGIPAAGDSGAA